LRLALSWVQTAVGTRERDTYGKSTPNHSPNVVNKPLTMLKIVRGGCRDGGRHNDAPFWIETVCIQT